MMSNEIQSLLTQADSMLDNGRGVDALALYARISELDPGNTDVLMMQSAILGESGRLDEAIACCRKTISLDPGAGDAHVMLGRLLATHGKSDEALVSLEYVVKQDPEYGEAWSTLSSVYLAQGRFVEAEQSSRQAIRWLPDSAEAYLNLGNALLSQGRHDDALVASAKAVELDRDNAMIWCSLGVIQERAERFENAQASYKNATKLAPLLSSAQIGLARIHSALGKLSTAEHVLSQALKAQPDDTGLQCAMGAFCESKNDLKQAETYFRQALHLNPGLVQAWVDLGNVLQNQERYAEAEQCYQDAIKIAPTHPEAHFNLGVAYQCRGLYERALSSLNQAIKNRPEFVEAHWYKSFICLLIGDYALGWDEYEWRLRQKANIPRPFLQPVWDGAPLNGRTILVHDEQGYGDTFQFVRYLSLVKAMGGRVVFECHSKLSAILKGLEGYDEIVERESPHEEPQLAFDTQIHLMSLPRVFGTQLAAVPQCVPYIKADPDRTQYWHERVAADHNFKVGLAWSSANNIRSCKLADFQLITEVPGLSLYSLQKGPGAEQADASPAGMNLIRLDREMDLNERFVDTAALMMNLDLIISIDTSIVHLAGAMGCPVWTLLSASPDWRWTHQGQSTPWYPTMRLFRQKTLDDWAGVVAQVRDSLSLLLQQRNP